MLDWPALPLLSWTVPHGSAVWFEIVWVLEGGALMLVLGLSGAGGRGRKKMFDWFLKAVS